MMKGKLNFQYFPNQKKIETRGDRKQIHPYENNEEGLESIRLFRLALALKIVRYILKLKCESKLIRKKSHKINPVLA